MPFPRHTEATSGIFINQRLVRRNEGKAKVLQEMPNMAVQASKKMQMPLCQASAKMTHNQCKGPRLTNIVLI